MIHLRSFCDDLVKLSEMYISHRSMIGSSTHTASGSLDRIDRRGLCVFDEYMSVCFRSRAFPEVVVVSFVK